MREGRWSMMITILLIIWFLIAVLTVVLVVKGIIKNNDKLFYSGITCGVILIVITLLIFLINKCMN